MYSSQDRVEKYLQRELTDDEAAIIDDVIATISASIETYTNRKWNPVDAEDGEDPEDQTYFYDGNGLQEIHIDDFTELTSLDLLDSDGNSYRSFDLETEVINYPLNKTTKHSIRLRSDRFPEGNGNVQVVGKFGAGTVPAVVITVCTALVGNFVNNMGQGAFKKESIEGYSYELSEASNDDEDVVKLLDPLKKFIL
jgi:hypothetical protein